MNKRKEIDPNYKANRRLSLGEGIIEIVMRESFNRRELPIVWSRITLLDTSLEEVSFIDISDPIGKITDEVIENAICLAIGYAKATRRTVHKTYLNVVRSNGTTTDRYYVDKKTLKTKLMGWNTESEMWECLE